MLTFVFGFKQAQSVQMIGALFCAGSSEPRSIPINSSVTTVVENLKIRKCLFFYNCIFTVILFSDEINHIMVIRGDMKPNKIRECSRGCSFKDASHANNIFIDAAELIGDPTLQTQTTQPSIVE